ncbi:MAG: hypothetical protein ABSG67_11650 [Thermoguttaceae bacterium]|jgi:hypothetical protein
MKAKELIAPILVIALGVTWLLNVIDIMPGVDWIWTVGLAAVGVITLLLGGINKLTVIVGLFLMISSVCSLLRQVGKLPIEREVPILTIILGILMLLVQILDLPMPEALKPMKDENRRPFKRPE